jgi:hypothetical protein
MTAADKPFAVSVVLATTNGQTLTVVVDVDGNATLRVAKGGHNRAVAKLAPETTRALSALLAPLSG